ncbi:TIR domain-containing protein [Desulfocicer niacini]
MKDMKKILWVDDEPAHVSEKAAFLEDSGFSVKLTDSPAKCMDILSSEKIDLLILDVMMIHTDELDVLDTKGGHATGQSLARWVKQKYPYIKIIGCSVRTDDETIQWFNKHTAGYWPKHELRPNSKFYRRVESVFENTSLPIRTFIVHGHADKEKYELKNYLQNVLKLDEPIILHEQASLGRTIIEKFEDESDQVDLVFVLLTPDDKVCEATKSNKIKRRARQNVIFEMGYFYGKLFRKSGKIILLYKGSLELPSDISGVIYINIDSGILSAGEEIRRELEGLR